MFAFAVALVANGALEGRPSTPSSSASVSSDAAPSGAISGHAGIVDGDTLILRGERIRLWGVDAPERDQQCASGDAPGRRATTALTRAINGRSVSCIARDRDDYGRLIASCQVAGADLGAVMVAQGWARDYTHFSRGFYQAPETEARRAERGIWALGCEAPWDYRRRTR